MRAVEFETELINSTIQIPEDVRSELSTAKDKHVRVIVMIDDPDENEEADIKKVLINQFLNGYDDSDAVYDSL